LLSDGLLFSSVFGGHDGDKIRTHTVVTVSIYACQLNDPNA
jgi:hypothetical protein